MSRRSVELSRDDTVGLTGSPSITSTLEPTDASTRARLTTVFVLPTEAVAEVTATVRNVGFPLINDSELRTVRYPPPWSRLPGSK